MGYFGFFIFMYKYLVITVEPHYFELDGTEKIHSSYLRIHDIKGKNGGWDFQITLKSLYCGPNRSGTMTLTASFCIRSLRKYI